MPLLIGGATTSRAHTALKIEPHYKSPTVWVKDASRAVGVAQSLLSDGPARAVRRRQRCRLRRDPRAPRATAATASALVSLEKARGKRFDGGWADYAPPAPRSPASPCSTTSRWRNWSTIIDWTPFFQTWELAGRYPAILDDASSARRRASCSPTRRRCSSGSSTRSG